MFSNENSSYKKDNPKIPYLRVVDDPFNDPYNQYLSELLEYFAPELLSRFRGVVVESSKKLKQREDELERLEQQKIELAAEAAAKREALDNSLMQLPEEPTNHLYEIILAVGLAVLLFVALLYLLDVDVKNILKPTEIPRTLIALAGSICINLASKTSIESYAFHFAELNYRQADPDRLEAEERKAFWRRFQEGESTIWLATILVLVETGLASAGLLQLIPESDTFLRVSSIIGASLAALANINLAWGMAISRADWKRDFLAKKQEIIVEQLNNLNESVAAKARLQAIEKRIANLEKIIVKEKEEATQEYQRWERDLKNYLTISVINSKDFYRHYQKPKLTMHKPSDQENLLSGEEGE